MTTAVIALLIVTAAAHAAKPGARATVAQKLNRALASTPMRNTGYALERAGWRYHIHPAFIAAIAGTESSFGAAACRNAPHNAFGLASCGNSWHVPDFPTWKSAYVFMAKFLTERWPGARTPWDYPGYAACSRCWGNATARHMQRLGFPPRVRYP